MVSWHNDIEDFTTEELRAEILRRDAASRDGRCWYCRQSLDCHTCKYAKNSPQPEHRTHAG